MSLPLTPQQLAEVDNIGRQIFDIPASVERTGVYHPGAFGWAPESLCVVLTELNCYPDKYTYRTGSMWDRWEREISAMLGRDVYFESINPAVAALCVV